jgi:hypothetical protein
VQVYILILLHLSLLSIKMSVNAGTSILLNSQGLKLTGVAEPIYSRSSSSNCTDGFDMCQLKRRNIPARD